MKMAAGVGNAPTYRRLQRRANLSQLPSLFEMVLPAGFAPATSRLSVERSTVELR